MLEPQGMIIEWQTECSILNMISSTQTTRRSTNAVKRAAIKHEQVIKTLARRGYHLEKKLGSGGFGAVHEGVCDQYSQRVAIKVIEFSKNKQGEVRSNELKDFDAEVEAMGVAKGSDYVVDLKSAFKVTNAEKGIIVMELGDGTDLDRYLKSRGRKLPKKEALWIGLCIARGISDLHKKDIVHRDLKEGNIVLFKDKAGDIEKVKIVDFGMAAKHGEHEGVGGTLHFMSDARIRDFHRVNDGPTPPVDKADDIFAFGCIMLELLGGKEEFSAWNRNRRDFRENGTNEPEYNPLKFPTRIRKAYKKSLIDLLQRCLDQDPTQRPSIEELEAEMENTTTTLSARQSQKYKVRRPKRKMIKKISDKNAFPIALRLRRRRVPRGVKK